MQERNASKARAIWLDYMLVAERCHCGKNTLQKHVHIFSVGESTYFRSTIEYPSYLLVGGVEWKPTRRCLLYTIQFISNYADRWFLDQAYIHLIQFHLTTIHIGGKREV